MRHQHQDHGSANAMISLQTLDEEPGKHRSREAPRPLSPSDLFLHLLRHPTEHHKLLLPNQTMKHVARGTPGGTCTWDGSAPNGGINSGT